MIIVREWIKWINSVKCKVYKGVYLFGIIPIYLSIKEKTIA